MDGQDPQVVDLAAIAADAGKTLVAGAIWSLGSADLNLNLVYFAHGDGVEPHVNSEVDVVGVVIRGEGVVEIDGRTERLQPGVLFFMPKGATRSIRSGAGELAYLTCHRRRAGLMPKRATHPRTEPGA
jgi:quercetin dioxygenase-like cupin family protein